MEKAEEEHQIGQHNAHDQIKCVQVDFASSQFAIFPGHQWPNRPSSFPTVAIAAFLNRAQIYIRYGAGPWKGGEFVVPECWIGARAIFVDPAGGGPSAAPVAAGRINANNG
jgi:hypothetical protein